MITHELKLNIKFCDDVLSGRKNFEIRKNNKHYPFQIGDHIRFKPVEKASGYTYQATHEISKKEYEITYVLSGRGLKEGYVALGIKAWY